MDLNKLQKELSLEEGKNLKMYLDSLKIPTIGIGHNLRDKPISERACQVIFEDDVAEVIAHLDQHLPWWREQDDVRQNALIDLCFNLGIDSLLGFKNTLKAWQEKRYEDAYNGLGASLWATQVGKRAQRIQQMVRTGEWPNDI